MGHVLLSSFPRGVLHTLPISQMRWQGLRWGARKNTGTVPCCPQLFGSLSGQLFTHPLDTQLQMFGSYLLSLWVLTAGGSGLEAVARELPSGSHCTCSDITLRILEELAGKHGNL